MIFEFFDASMDFRDHGSETPALVSAGRDLLHHLPHRRLDSPRCCSIYGCAAATTGCGGTASTPVNPAGRPRLDELPDRQQHEFHSTFSREFLEYLDRGHGACVLKKTRVGGDRRRQLAALRWPAIHPRRFRRHAQPRSLAGVPSRRNGYRRCNAIRGRNTRRRRSTGPWGSGAASGTRKVLTTSSALPSHSKVSAVILPTTARRLACASTSTYTGVETSIRHTPRADAQRHAECAGYTEGKLMADPKKIENAIRRVRNQKSFIQELLDRRAGLGHRRACRGCRGDQLRVVSRRTACQRPGQAHR